MNAGLLFAVSAVEVLNIIFWVGIGFIFLWFLGSCVRDGMWNNAIRCFNAYVAVLLSFPLGVALGAILGLIMGATSGSPDAYSIAAISIGGAWVSFLICLAILQALTDKLSQVKVPFHPIANTIGSFVFICAISLVFLSLSMPVRNLVMAVK